MNLNIGNEKINNTSFSTTTKSTSAKTTSSTSSAPIKMIDEEKQKLCKLLNISSDEYDAIIAQNPSFKTANADEQQKIVTNYRAELATKTDKAKTTQTAETQTENNPETETTSDNEFVYANKAEYNKKDINGKIEACYTELAKNIYIHGAKFGKTSISAHTAEDWAKLTDTEKQAEVEKLKQYTETIPELKELKNKFDTNISDPKKKELLVDTMMNAIQAASTTDNGDKAGMAFTDFIKLEEYQRAEKIEEYLKQEKVNNESNLNDSDKLFLERSALLKEQVAKAIGKEDSAQNLDASDVARYMKYNNLNEDELLYNGLKEKLASGNLSSEGQERLEDLKAIFETDGGKEIVKASKAKNALSLKAEYDALTAKLQNGEKLSNDEITKQESLKKYLDSEEGKLALKDAQNLPKPQNDYEKSIIEDYKSITTQIEGTAHGSDIKSVGILAFISQKTDGMSEDEELKYVSTFMRLNPSTENRAILARYKNKFPQLLENKDLFITTATVELTDNESESFNNAIQNAYAKGTKSDKKLATMAANTRADYLRRTNCNGSEYDTQKVQTTNTMSMISSNEDLNSKGVSLAASITDAKKSKEAITNISNSKNANDDTQIAITEASIHATEDAQAYYIKIAGRKSAKATAHIAKNDIISQLSTRAQSEAFIATHANIEKHFKGQQAIEYSNALSDQIQNCDRDNQLAMHNEMMTSKYSEVVEHVADNVKNYDVSVQSKAIESIVASGNSNATEVALSNLATSAPSVVQDEANLKGILYGAYTENVTASTDKTELQQKIASGARLTPQEYYSLSDKEKQEYKTNFFKSLSPAKQIAMLSNLTDASMKKTIFKKLINQDKNFFRSLVESDATTAEFAYNSHIGEEIVMEVANRKAASDIKFALLSQKIDKDYQKKNSLNSSATSSNYATLPNYIDRKGIYPKTKQGHILA